VGMGATAWEVEGCRANSHRTCETQPNEQQPGDTEWDIWGTEIGCQMAAIFVCGGGTNHALKSTTGFWLHVDGHCQSGESAGDPTKGPWRTVRVLGGSSGALGAPTVEATFSSLTSELES
jgi:hypothetical protein